MVFDNSVVKSIYSPLIILSLILRGTGGRSRSEEVVKLVGIVFIIKNWFISLGGALLVWWCMDCIIEGPDNSSSPLPSRSWLLVDGNWLLIDGTWLLASIGWLFESDSWSIPTSTSLLPAGDWLVVPGIWLLWTAWLCCDGVNGINWCKRFDNWLANCWENKLLSDGNWSAHCWENKSFPAGGLISVAYCCWPFWVLGWDHGIVRILSWHDLGDVKTNELPLSPCYPRKAMNTSSAVCEAFSQTINAAAPSKPYTHKRNHSWMYCQC